MHNSIKVLHLCSSLGFFGAENVIIELSKEMKYQGYDPVVGVFNNFYNPHLELAFEAEKNRIKVQIFPCRKKFDFQTVNKIRSFLKANNVDILHTHGYKSNLYGLLGSTRETVKVATNHMWIRSNLKSKIYCMVDSVLIRFYEKIIAVSEPIRHDMIKKGIKPDKIAVIYNGIDAQRFQKKFDTEKIRAQFNIPKNSKVVGTVGSLITEKGHIYFIDAAKKVLKKFPNTKFLIVGEGRCRRELEDKVKKLRLGNSVILAGLRNDMPEIYSLMDVFVLPSINEGMPMVLLEAMASKKPVIATKVGSIPKAVIDKYTGMLVNPRDIDNLENAISFMIKNEDAARTYARNGSKKLQNEFLSELMCKRYIALYRSSLRRIERTNRL